VTFVLWLLAASACASGPVGDKLAELRQLPEQQRISVFHKLNEEEKIELFFKANRRHPPYTGLNDAVAKEGKFFLIRLRGKLDSRGGVPEVLSFMSIVFDMKNRGMLSHEDVRDLHIEGICELAKPSKYCPTLEAKLLAK
jgi:hypothetical protein